MTRTSALPTASDEDPGAVPVPGAEIHRLHPALIRPGRCLARIEFTSFRPAEAAEWLPPGSQPPDQDATLAELFERRGTVSRIGIEPETPERAGVYL